MPVLNLNMEKIILDTNFLLIPAQFGVDIFAEIKRIADFRYELYILDKSLDELNKISEEQKGKLKREVNLALQIIKENTANGNINVINTSGTDKNVDDIIVSLQDYITATQDIELQRRLKGKGARIISLRQKKYLFFK